MYMKWLITMCDLTSSHFFPPWRVQLQLERRKYYSESGKCTIKFWMGVLGGFSGYWHEMRCSNYTRSTQMSYKPAQFVLLIQTSVEHNKGKKIFFRLLGTTKSITFWFFRIFFRFPYYTKKYNLFSRFLLLFPFNYHFSEISRYFLYNAQNPWQWGNCYWNSNKLN